jgi:hypothetical protein
MKNNNIRMDQNVTWATDAMDEQPENPFPMNTYHSMHMNHAQCHTQNLTLSRSVVTTRHTQILVL